MAFLRSPITNATIWRVLRHIAVHNHLFCTFFTTKLHTSPPFEDIIGRGSEKNIFDLWQFLSVSLGPLRNGLSSNPKNTLHTTQARTLLAGLENSFFSASE